MADQKIKLEGDLSEISVPHTFHALSISDATGVFEWNFASKEKKVYISGGRIVFASSNQIEERLGEVLLRSGRIRVKDFIEGSKKITRKKRFGQILIEMGALKKEDIKQGVIDQVREIIYRLFNESEGHFVFYEQEPLPREVITLNINTPELIMKGVQKITNWNCVFQTIGRIETIFEPAAGAQKKLSSVPLSAEEKKIYEFVDGMKTIQQICSVAVSNDFETCRTLMAFLCANLIRKITDSEITVVEEKKGADFFDKTILCYNKLYSYIYRYLGDKVGRLGDKNLSHYLEEIKGDHPVLLKGIFLLPDGTLASEVLRENFETLSQEKRKEELLAGLKALISAELAATRESLGKTEEAFVASRLRAIVENLNSGKKNNIPGMILFRADPL